MRERSCRRGAFWPFGSRSLEGLGCLGGEHLREFADGGFHGAPGPHQTGDGAGIPAVRHVLAQRRLEVDVAASRFKSPEMKPLSPISRILSYRLGTTSRSSTLA